METRLDGTVIAAFRVAHAFLTPNQVQTSSGAVKFPEGPILGTRQNQIDRDHMVAGPIEAPL
jgi:hypothetical protein